MGETALSFFGVSGMGLLLLAVLLPIMFKFGVEKGRYIMMAVFVLCFMLPVLLSGMGLRRPDSLPKELSGLPVWLIPAGLVAALILAWILSITLSVRIYRKKEF